MKITKSEFDAYEKVRQSGVTNMFDTTTVSALSGLTREEIMEIMSKYTEYKEAFYGSEDPEYEEEEE